MELLLLHGAIGSSSRLLPHGKLSTQLCVLHVSAKPGHACHGPTQDFLFLCDLLCGALSLSKGVLLCPMCLTSECSCTSIEPDLYPGCFGEAGFINEKVVIQH